MNIDLPVLIIDDEEYAISSYQMALAGDGIENVIPFTRAKDALDFLSVKNAALILLDLIMPELNGIDFLEILHEKYSNIPVIVITGAGDVDTIVRCMKNGAFDFILKPVDPIRLATTVRHALSFSELQRQNTLLREKIYDKYLNQPRFFANIITQSPAMLAIFSYIEDIAVSGQPVLITGETGTGKEMIAEAVHKCSAREGRFVTINVAGLDDNIFSDTLFGHEKGSFTGADRKRDGLIQTASGGTIFLDEIGDLSHNSQVKLLRLIQQGEYYPLGSDLPKTSDAAIVVATNKTTDYLKNSEEFRTDLYYRLKTHHVALPPLRDRKDDIKLLVETFFKKACADFNRRPFDVSDKIYPMLEAYSFPGNIRELKSFVDEAVSLKTNTEDFTRYFEEKLLTESKNLKKDDPAPVSPVDVKSFVKLPTMDEMELLLINEALRRCGGKRNEAAEMIGITRQTLHRRLKAGPADAE